MAPGLANALPPGSAKFGNTPPPGLTWRANALQWPGGGGAGRRWNWLMHKVPLKNSKKNNMQAKKPYISTGLRHTFAIASSQISTMMEPWEDTQGLHCKYPRELHTIPYNFIIRNCMEPSRRLFFISLGAADFVTYDQREVFFPTPFCQENVIIWKQTRHDRVGRPKPAKIKGFSSSISEVSFVSIWSK